MKKFIAIMLSLSAGIVVLGLIILTIGGFKQIRSNYFNIGFGNIGWSNEANSKPYGTAQQREKQADSAQYKNIRLELVNSQLDVIKTDDTKIRLTYDEYFENEWTYTDSGDKIYLKYYEDSDNWLNNIFHWTHSTNDYRHTVKLYLPADSKVSLRVTSVNGDSTIDSLSFDSLDLEGVNANYSLSDITAQSGIDLQNVNGGFKLKNVSAPTLDISSLVTGHCDIQTSQIASIDAKGLVNSPISISGITSSEDYRVSYQLVNGSVNFDGDNYNGNGDVGSKSAKNHINFDGVNSSLTISREGS